MGPMYELKDLARIWNEFLESKMSSGILTQPMSKEFVKATRDAIVDKVGGIFVSEKEQKRVAEVIKKLQHEVFKLKTELGKHSKPIWWHWIMEQCRNEKCTFFGSNSSQGPIHDDLGEDINLYERIRKYKEEQNDGTTDYKCDGCGSKLHMMHRHAIVDCNCIIDENGDPIRKEPLIEGLQNEGDGKFITEEEFNKLKTSVNQKQSEKENQS
jgi:DNA-directed RNA polymerase subunit RPC12/RpoP